MADVPSRRRLAFMLASLAACARADARPSDLKPEAHPQLAGTLPITALASVVPTAASATSPAAAPAVVEPAEPAADDDAEVTLFDLAPAVIRLDTFAEVRAEPRADAPLLGIISIGERVHAWAPMPADDCVHGWRAIAPRGFVCSKTSASARPPSDDVLPRLPGKALVPGTYGKVRGDVAKLYTSLDDAVHGRNGRAPAASLTVRRQDRLRAGGREFWRTRHGFVAATDVRELSSSRFHGTALADDDGLVQPLAWARFRGNDGTIAVRARPSDRAPIVAKLPARRTVRVLEHSDDGEYVRSDRGWIARDELRIATRAAAPATVAADERWLDIDLDEQVLVAYVGDRPIYATLISSGRRGHDTPTGVFRIERKVAERTMNSRPDDDDPYAVDRVPWTAYFADSFALHAAYWHGSFGERKSHGCVNLSPADARVLYRWSAPGVAPGWSEVYGHADQPGSVVRIRSAADPEPSLQGYAAELAIAQ
jgi:L,D-transpeptidase catalytic domain